MSKVLTRPLRVLIQGKDQLGKAKYVNVTESGDLRVQLSGNPVRTGFIYPSPAKPDFELLDASELGFYTQFGEDTISLSPLWMGKDGEKTLMLAHYASVQLYYSEDAGETWTNVAAGGKFNWIQWALVIPGKSIILCDQQPGEVSKIYVSTNFETGDHRNWTHKVTADSGYFSFRYGLSNRGNVILVSTYGSDAKHLYISLDCGNNWITKDITEHGITVKDPNDTFHIHDVEYDPWNGRIWLSTGDRANGGLWYSDDWGNTFSAVDPERIFSAGHPTSILALPDRVLFGSDGVPNGYYVWYRDKRENTKPVTVEDITHLYTPDNLEQSRHLSVANITHTQVDSQIREYPYNVVMLLTNSTAGGQFPCRLIATPNGEDFWEIFRMDQIGLDVADATAGRLIGPVSSNGEIFLGFYHASVGSKWVKLKIPEWVTTN